MLLAPPEGSAMHDSYIKVAYALPFDDENAVPVSSFQVSPYWRARLAGFQVCALSASFFYMKLNVLLLLLLLA